MIEVNKISDVESMLRSREMKGSVYFLGIGGIGMSALARYFYSGGMSVSGYDKTETPLTNELQHEGIKVHFNDDISMIDKEAVFVVYTPAIPADHKELNYFKMNNYVLLKRSEVLGLITSTTFNICVAGTHGKTTTSSMISHILRDSGYGCTAFLGGIAANYNTNFWKSDNNVCVAEADEYDRSFLKLSPDVAVITSMDADHLDIYGSEENMQDAFVSFSKTIREEGLLIYKHNISRSKELKGDHKISYSMQDNTSNAYAENIRIRNGSYMLDIKINEKCLQDVQLNMGGRHNIENAVAAITAASYLGVDDNKIKSAVSSFTGVKRRFEYILKSKNNVLIDDYAHHPEELRALITGVKELYQGIKCTVIFQPHLFSRTQDHAKGFGEVLSLADEVLLLPIYPAREEPIPGVTSKLILDEMREMNKQIVNKENLTTVVEKLNPALLIVAGAGDIDTCIEPLKNVLNKA